MRGFELETADRRAARGQGARLRVRAKSSTLPFRVEIVQGGTLLENNGLDGALRMVYSIGLWEGPVSIGNVGPRDMFVALLKGSISCKRTWFM